MTREQGFTLARFLSRWLASIFVVFATYNPTGYSYYHWLIADPENNLAVKVTVGLFLVTAYAVAARISRVALGNSGFVTALAAALLFSFGMISLVSPGTRFAEAVRYLHLVSLATAIAVGVSWSHIKHRVTGQRTSRYVS